MSSQAISKPYDASFKPEAYLKILDELEEKARDDSVFVPDEEYSDDEQEYVRTYVSRRHHEYMAEYCLLGLAAIREYLSADNPVESKESETLAYFKHSSRRLEQTVKDTYYVMKLRYHPEELLDGYDSDEDDEDRCNRQEHLDKNGAVIRAPETTDPVELDEQWADISDEVREYALIAFTRKIYDMAGICAGTENKIRSDQRTRQVRASRAEKGVKQIVKIDGNRHIIREIPISDPLPEGFSVSDY